MEYKIIKTDTKITVEEYAKILASKAPKETSFNNTKSRKYFASTQEDLSDRVTIKDNLLYKSHKSLGTIMESQGDLSNRTHMRNNSRTLKVDKSISKFIERQFERKEFHKIPAKIMEDDEVYVDSDEDVDDIEIFNHNKTLDNVEQKHTDDSFINEKLNNTDINNVKINFNYENLILIENLYFRLLREFEIKKDKFDSIILTWFDFMSTNQDIYSISSIFSDKSMKKNLKKFFTFELIVYSLTFMRDLSNDQLYNAFKTCFFYLHQNFLIIIFSIILKSNKDVLNNNELAKKCKNKVDENNIWINKTTYKSIFLNNNSTIHNIIKSILKIIKTLKSNSLEENRNITIINNYIKNFTKFKTEVMKAKLFEKLIKSKINVPIDKETKIDKLNDSLETETYDTDKGSNKLIIPYLKPIKEKKYTLVLDLDETLVHYVEEGDSAFIQIRPGCESFIEEMAKFYEIVIFTAAMQDYADLVLDELDKNNYISYRLYRQHTKNVNNVYIKDLSRLGRDLNKIIIIDNVADNFQLQKENGLNIRNFEGDENDNELNDLIYDLKKIVENDAKDVREFLGLIQNKMDKRNHQQIDFSFIAN